MLKVREFTIRKIIPEDNAALEQLVCVVLEEHGAIGEGYASSDPELLDMYTSYNQEKCIYYTLLLNGVVVGGAGIAPLKNSSSEWCELQKMYFWFVVSILQVIDYQRDKIRQSVLFVYFLCHPLNSS